MFTGIIETLGVVKGVEKMGGNHAFWIAAPFYDEIKIDQSIAHNGVCLTVDELKPNEKWYRVTAVDETLNKTNIGQLIPGSVVNLERCMQMGGRLDGHIVQGHVDCTATCTEITDADGSWLFHFKFENPAPLMVEKGSICINGTSLTCFNVSTHTFSVTIIPYTLEHTNFHTLKAGTQVNIEFDIIGKYVSRISGFRD